MSGAAPDTTASPTGSVVLGVGGGIAAYKVCHVLRGLVEAGVDVDVVPTEAALRFVGVATWEALSGRPVRTSVWEDVPQVPHVRLGQQARLVLVAPATADLLARAAHGLADDLLTATLLTARCPVVMAPAMHTEMWEHRATQANVATLRERGVQVLDPASGRLTGADTGPGRLPEPDDLLSVARAVLARQTTDTASPDVPSRDLAGLRVLITAGGTREPVDPVRFLGNRSSGRQGWALARTAAARGADVTLVTGPTELADPAWGRTVRVQTALQMQDAVLAQAADADIVVMAAAVADFRPARPSDVKLKKRPDAADEPISLVRNPDILATLAHERRRPGQVVVGFAAETGDETGSVLDLGRAKLAAKGCDLLVVNDVSAGQGFEVADNAAVILGADGSAVVVPHGPKEALADVVWDCASAHRLTDHA
jgi:phosphopantothenoylcysteine decarboxylase/phosphopantothenate--cysteine ligase